MKIRILAVGRLKEDYLKAAQQEYATRLRPFTQVEVAEVKDEPLPEIGNLPLEREAKNREGEKLLALLGQGPSREYKIVLDVQGRQLSSEDFSAKLRDAMDSGSGSIAFIIGGASGLAPEVLQTADLTLSLSKMTLPHQLARVLLLEQIYRAFKIMRNEPYHR